MYALRWFLGRVGSVAVDARSGTGGMRLGDVARRQPDIRRLQQSGSCLVERLEQGVVRFAMWL